MPSYQYRDPHVNTLRPRQNGCHFADVLKCIFLNGNLLILIKISLKFVPKGPINNIPAMVQIMAWRRACDKPLSEPMMVSLPTHICVTRPQWVKDKTVSRPNVLSWTWESPYLEKVFILRQDPVFCERNKSTHVKQYDFFLCESHQSPSGWINMNCK